MLRPICVIGNQLEGNYLLRMHQYQKNDTENLQIAKQIIANKIKNQTILLQNIREKTDIINISIKNLETSQASLLSCTESASLRGIEGNAAKTFFQTYFKECGRYRRAPRTREDPINFLMDIGYSLLYGVVESHLSLYGFDIYKGFFHTQFYERKSLVCDAIEPFRCIIDMTIRKAYNLKQINFKDFKKVDNELTLDREARKKYVGLFLKVILEYKGEIFFYNKEIYKALVTDDTKFPTFYFPSTL